MVAYGFQPPTRKNKSRKGDPLFEKDTRDRVDRAGERLGWHGLLPMPAALQGDRQEHRGYTSKPEDPRTHKRRDDERDIADKKYRYKEDMQHQVRSGLVITRITIPLPAQQLRNIHGRPLLPPYNQRKQDAISTVQVLGDVTTLVEPLTILLPSTLADDVCAQPPESAGRVRIRETVSLSENVEDASGGLIPHR